MSLFDRTKANARGSFGKKNRIKFDDPKHTGLEQRREMQQKIDLDRIISVLERQGQ